MEGMIQWSNEGIGLLKWITFYNLLLLSDKVSLSKTHVIISSSHFLNLFFSFKTIKRKKFQL